MAYELPGVYPKRRITGGSPIGAIGNLLVAVLGRGDKKLSAPSMLPAVAILGGVLPIATYYYKITAYNANGETTQSGEVNATTDASKKMVTLTWVPIQGATGYKIYRSSTTGVYVSPTLVATVIGANANTYTDNIATLAAGAPPSSNTALMVAYNTPQIYYAMSNVRDNHGMSSQLGLCSSIAEKLNLGRLMVVSVDYTTVDAAVGDPAKLVAKAAVYQTALDALKRKTLDIVCVCEPEIEISSIVKQHVENMSTDEEKKFRTAILASGLNDTIGDISTSATILYNCNSVNNRRDVLCAPNSPIFTYIDEIGQPVQSQLSGSFNAFFVACMKSMAGDPAVALTNAQASVFDGYATEYLPSEQKALIMGGCTVVIPEAPGQQTIVDCITTSLASAEDSYYEIVTADDYIITQLIAANKPYIGKKITRALLDAMFTKNDTTLSQMESDLILTEYSGLEVVQDEVVLNNVRVRFQYQPMRSARKIFIDYAFDLTTGAALRR